jgi:peroxiredoxin
MLRSGSSQNYAYTLRHVAYAAIAASLFATGCAAKAKAPRSAPSPLLGAPVPDFARAALDGSRVDTAALRGRVLVLDFFAEHCVPCAQSLPWVEAMHRSEPGIAIIGVSEDDDAEGARRVAARHGLTFPVVYDGGHALAGRFRAMELPATFVVDPRGVVRWHGAFAAETAMQAVIEEAR